MWCSDLLNNLNELLKPDSFTDYCPNGLQIQGESDIRTIVSGVSLNQELIDIAISKKASAIIVHHGIFWHKSSYAITGVKYQRIAKLITNNINLFAYHLPLDAHHELGNNFQLAKLLDLKVIAKTGMQNLLWSGKLLEPMLLEDFISLYVRRTSHQPVYFGLPNKLISKIAWCTGGADSMFEEAINLGVDVFLTGEINESVMHLSKESQVAFIAGGHYVTERYGIMALTNYLSQIGLKAEFIDLYNPV